MRLAAIQALRVTVKVPDRAKVKGAGTSAIVDLVGFREDNVLPVAAFFGRGTTTINYLAEVSEAPTVDAVLVGDENLTNTVTVVGVLGVVHVHRALTCFSYRTPLCLSFVVDNRPKRVCANGDDRNAKRLAYFPSGQVRAFDGP